MPGWRTDLHRMKWENPKSATKATIFSSFLFPKMTIGQSSINYRNHPQWEAKICVRVNCKTLLILCGEEWIFERPSSIQFGWPGMQVQFNGPAAEKNQKLAARHNYLVVSGPFNYPDKLVCCSVFERPPWLLLNKFALKVLWKLLEFDSLILQVISNKYRDAM